MTQVSAPGKMVLLGEYAVLSGAPAVVAAVNRRAAVETAHSPSSNWVVTAPGFSDRSAEFEIDADGAPRWLVEGNQQAFILVDRLLRELSTGALVDLKSIGPLEMTLDTREFFESTGQGRAKLGLGSSAALTVALVSALAARAGIDRVGFGLQTMIDLHRHAQGGLGSGVDVAASVHGGVIRFQLEAERQATATPLALPSDLHLAAYWTGTSASTGSFLEALQKRRVESPKEVDVALEVLREVSSDGMDSLAAGSTPGFLSAVDRFWVALVALGRAIEMPIVSEPHQRLRSLAEEHGVCYKPSGAGGGDFGVAFAADRGPLQQLSAAARDSAFGVLDLAVDPRGVF